MKMCVNNTILNFTDMASALVNGSDSVVPYAACVYQDYDAREKEQVEAYKMVGYVLGTLIILSNIVVVISSGLILIGKGQQSKSTYLILGNVSLADTFVGISLIIGLAIDNPTNDNMLCVIQMGLLTCPTMVSIFSVGLIAVDRYLYILHGLYYQRWFSSTRVRVGIVCLWTIGIILGFLPATGWTNQELRHTRCLYVGLFPTGAILLNSILSIIPIALVGVLYTIILIKAVKTVNNIKAATPNNNIPDTTLAKPKLRMSRGTVNYKKQNSSQSLEPPKCSAVISVCRSASFNLDCVRETENTERKLKSKRLSEYSEGSSCSCCISDNRTNDDAIINKTDNRSELSVITINSNVTEKDLSNNTRKTKENAVKPNKNNKLRKIKEPNKWRAVTVVMLTSGSVIFTWLPFFLTVIFFVFCEDKLVNPRCLYIRSLLSGPLATLAFLNSILNPIIYAWWHKGFKKSVRTFYKKYFRKLFLISR